MILADEGKELTRLMTTPVHGRQQHTTRSGLHNVFYHKRWELGNLSDTTRVIIRTLT